jgi:hypothetical protein
MRNQVRTGDRVNRTRFPAPADDVGESASASIVNWARTDEIRQFPNSRFKLLALILVFAWSLVELPLEITLAQSPSEKAVILCSKAFLGLIVLLAGRQMHWAELAFMFSCTLSILAIAPMLATELTVFPTAFLLSFVECVLKAIALFVFARSAL